MALIQSEYKILQLSAGAPDFSLPCIDGNTYSLEQLKGEKATLIIFLCNHCPYVVPKIKELRRIATDFKEKGLVVIGINPNESENHPEDSFEKMKEYFERWDVDFFYLHDETQEVAKAYGAVCTPDPFLFNEEGKLVYHGRIDDVHGEDESNVQELYEAIGELIETGKIVHDAQPSMGCSIKWKD